MRDQIVKDTCRIISEHLNSLLPEERADAISAAKQYLDEQQANDTRNMLKETQSTMCMSHNAFAGYLGVSAGHLSEVYSGTRNAGAKILRQIGVERPKKRWR